MSLILDILEELSNVEIRYKGGVGINLFGMPRFESQNKQSLKSSFYRLSRGGYIEKEASGWRLTETGKKYLKSDHSNYKTFSSPFKKESPKNLIVIFDIPEERRSERDWFRSHLRRFDYLMIQRSVWVGPSPLPKEFQDYLKKLKLKSCLKTFKLSKSYKAK
ncbi:MAG: hypothetical protein V4469_02390 [Patescibacteria group bacterium]